MKKIYIKTTESCQLQCDHCYIGENRSKKTFFNAEKTIAWLNNYLDDKEKAIISFHGGEPFLADLDEMQKVCDAFSDAYFDATTNLMFPINKIQDIMKFIKKNFKNPDTGRPFIKTSWDYIIRFPGVGSEQIWRNNLVVLLYAGIDVEVITCLTRLLIRYVSPREYLILMHELGIRYINFERLTENTTENKKLIPDYKDVDVWLTECYRQNEKLFKEPLIIDMFENMKWAAKGIYLSCRERACMKQVRTINADGTIGGCPNTSITEAFADINGFYDEEKHRELMKKEQKQHLECFSCELFQACHGDCHQLSWQGSTCPEPKTLLKEIINDVESKKKTVLPHA